MKVILIGLTLVAALDADERRWKLHPSLDLAVEQLKIGELTVVNSSGTAFGTVDDKARVDLVKALAANDKEEVKELIDARKVSPLSPGTEVRILERNESDLDKLMDTVHQLVDIDVDLM